ncbi:metal-dependent hydrolase [Aquabacterium sp. A7-Y]|uniref:metal-dependent hydrolase n=1 Tax=Aquabacterium sp. A7-Y TaxID=1349605 RepID=UPI00223CB3FA|nr:metal-dependent hydrolase [Aquabacterium sp. A7-Y]MCW7537275.1 metal-dependent hydrolase [Aquabacterium sp. A7-Y]
MDSLSQLALGAAVGIAVMGRRTAVWKAALWGGVCGTLPDLDAFVDHGDPVSNMTLHRTESHALFYQTLLAPLLAGLIAKLHRETDRFRGWWAAVWLALVTHPLLDWMTVYGTQLGLPFTDHPYGVGSVFIIDPLYTVPLLIGVGVAMARRNPAGWRWNAAGLVLSTAYLGWGVAAQQHVDSVVRASLQTQGLQAERLLVTPTPFNTVLWRIVAITPEGYSEAYHSLLDEDHEVRFEPHARGEALWRDLRGNPAAERMAWFTHGFFKLSEQDGELRIADLRMGMEPHYSFSFVVARRAPGGVEAVTPRHIEMRPDLRQGLSWLWRRAAGEPLPPPR